MTVYHSVVTIVEDVSMQQTLMNVFPTVVMIWNCFVKIWKDCAENTRDSIVNRRSKSENV